MISIKDALQIKDGDHIHDYCGRKLLVHSYSVMYEKGLPISIEFGCKDINTNVGYIYRYDEIYTNFDNLTVRQQLFLKWFRSRPEYYFTSDDEIRLLKEAYLAGFYDAKDLNLKNAAQLQLQK